MQQRGPRRLKRTRTGKKNLAATNLKKKETSTSKWEQGNGWILILKKTKGQRRIR